MTVERSKHPTFNLALEACVPGGMAFCFLMKVFKVELNESVAGLKFYLLVVELNIYLKVLRLREYSIFQYALMQMLQISRSTKCVPIRLIQKFSRNSEGIRIPAIFLPICI